MKRILLFSMLAALFIPFVLVAQPNEKVVAKEVRMTKVTTEKKGGREIVVTKEVKEIRRPLSRSDKKGNCYSLLSSFEIGFTDLVSSDYSMYPQTEHGFMDLHNAKSIHVALYLMGMDVPLNRRRTLGFSTGLGLAWDNYVFDNDITLVKANGVVVPVAIDPKYKKSKLSTFSLTVPLVLGVKLNNFSVSGGVYGSLILSQHTKYKKPKHKEKGLSYANMLQGGLTARIGFKGVNLFANYALTDLFKHDKGPGVQPLTVGIGFW